MYLLEDDNHWESTLYEGVNTKKAGTTVENKGKLISESVLCLSAKSIKYLFLKSLSYVFFGKIIAKAWLKIYCITDV